MAAASENTSYSLFADDNLKAAFNSFSKEDQEKYKKQGEIMYSVEYDKIGNDPQQKLIESAAYIAEGLKSGLLPSQLDKDEVNVMRSLYGEKWYERYGYTSENE